MSKIDYYGFIFRRCMRSFLVLACVVLSLPVILIGYEFLWIIPMGDKLLGIIPINYHVDISIGTCFLLIGFFYICLLLLMFYFRLRKETIKEKAGLLLFHQLKKGWLFYLITGITGYVFRVIIENVSIYALRSFVILVVVTFLIHCIVEVADQKLIDAYRLFQKQTSLVHLNYIGAQIVSEELIMLPNSRAVPVDRVYHYYRMSHTPFYLIILQRGPDKNKWQKLTSFFDCLSHIVISGVIIFLSIYGMIQEYVFWRYLGTTLAAIILLNMEAQVLVSTCILFGRNILGKRKDNGV